VYIIIIIFSKCYSLKFSANDNMYMANSSITKKQARYVYCVYVSKKKTRFYSHFLFKLAYIQIYSGLGHAELGQRDWDRRYRDNLFVFYFCDMNVERKFFFAIVCNLIVVVTNTTVESLR